MLELWQADADGSVVQQEGSLRRDGWTFTGWGRASTDDTGSYTFTTLKPGRPRPARQRSSPSRSSLAGCSNRLFTRAYLPEDAAALAADPLLSSLDAEPDARRSCRRADERGLRFDIGLQGERRDRLPALPGTLKVTDLFWPGDERAGALMSERGSADGDGSGRGRLAGRPWSHAGIAPAAAQGRDPPGWSGTDDVDRAG